MRRTVRAARDALPQSYRDGAAPLIGIRVLQEIGAMQGMAVASYMSFGTEWNTALVNGGLLARGAVLLLPRIDTERRQLVLHRVTDLHRDLVPGLWGIPEPDPSRCPAADPATVTRWLVPGLAFDRLGGRLGYGRGYYDRLLAEVEAPVIAAAFDVQIVSRVPMESHDRRVGRVFTESGEVTAPGG